jgi:mannose-1-phosphate guanylyltransferase / phosphomannomutase
MQSTSFKDNSGPKRKAVFLDRDGVLNVERSYISNPEDFELYDFTPAAIRKLNRAGFLSVVVSNQSAVARNMCTEEDVKAVHKRMELLLSEEKAYLDAIYYCPHFPSQPTAEYNPRYAIDCDCRKPKTGMFLRAIDEFNIDPSVSYMIGDSERDIIAGRDAGCITIGVRTGHGLREAGVSPDYMFANLSEAVDFIIGEIR